jgi:D-alanyl-lipoteichoic acid acyltransferase DltB (MBOAT superfamily)
MVFSSLEFIYLFLPPVLIGFLCLRALKLESAIIWWLIMASLVFYLCWSPKHLILLLFSIGFNYLIHLLLKQNRSKAVLTLGIIVNLGMLGVFKYADFFIGNFNTVTGYDAAELGLILPLAISFYTFQQISFLRDTYQDKLVDCDFKKYMLFVTFFPQLIAGPIVMQRDTIPQFTLGNFSNRYLTNIMTGATLFSIGLFKKIVLADGIAPVANAVFTMADQGTHVPMEAAWLGAIAYTFQIYFDFSGYCDMALGLALMFGIRLPINFNSPYRSLSIVEFWRRWHITLSRFLRDYLYIPLGGNKSGILGTRGNLAITMLLGGLWHGAGWNFIIWGALHGGYLMINHIWSGSNFGQSFRAIIHPYIYASFAWSVTMIAVVFAWVFFRAETFDGASLMVQAMVGYTDFVTIQTWQEIVPNASMLPYALLAMTAIVVLLPNSIEFTRNYKPVLDTTKEVGKPLFNWFAVHWSPRPAWATAIAAVALVSVIQIYRLNNLTEFIYFNF